MSMGPYNCWVHDVFHNILIDSCDEYLKTSDRSTDKARSLFVTRIASDITQAAVDNNIGLPNDLEKVNHISQPIPIPKYMFTVHLYMVWELCFQTF